MAPKSARPKSSTGRTKSYRSDTAAKASGSWLFGFLDADQNGFLCEIELARTKEVMLSVTWGQDITQTVDSIGSFDADANGKVDEQEWHCFMEASYDLVGRKKFMEAVGMLQSGGCNSDSSPAKQQGVVKSKSKTRMQAPQDQGYTADDQAAERAALAIQKVQRGKTARAQVQQIKAAKPVSTNQTATTVGDIWDMVTIYHFLDGKLEPRMKIQVQDFVFKFHQCREFAALGLALQRIAPCIPSDDVGTMSEPQDFSTGEVDCLLCAVLRGQISSVISAREWLQEASEQGKLCNLANGTACEDEIKLSHFRKTIGLISNLMLIDQQCLLSVLSWNEIQRFELSEMLAVDILEQVAHLGCRGALFRQLRLDGKPARDEERSSVSGDTSVLQTEFRLGDFAKMIYNAGLDDPHERRGIRAEEIQNFWRQINAKLPQLLKAHAERGRKTLPPLPARNLLFLRGQTELEILLNELHKRPPLCDIFASPFHMIVHMFEHINTSCGGVVQKLESVESAMRAGQYSG